MINKFTNKKILLAVTLIFLSNCSANKNLSINNNVMNNQTDFSYKNNYVSCGSYNDYRYNNYSYQAAEYNFRCRNSWHNQKSYGHYDPKNKKWIYPYAKK